MVYQTAYNATDAPLVADDFGRTIGGHEFGTVETTCDAIEAAARDGRVHIFPGGIDAAPGQNPQAVEAQERTRVYAERASVLHSADKADVVEFARNAGLIDDDADPHKADLIGILTPRVDLDISDLHGRPAPAIGEPQFPPAQADPVENPPAAASDVPAAIEAANTAPSRKSRKEKS